LPRNAGNWPISAPPDHQDVDPVVAVHLLAELDETLVHRPGHRIPLVRPVDGQIGDPPLDFKEHLG